MILFKACATLRRKNIRVIQGRKNTVQNSLSIRSVWLPEGGDDQQLLVSADYHFFTGLVVARGLFPVVDASDGHATHCPKPVIRIQFCLLVTSE